LATKQIRHLLVQRRLGHALLRLPGGSKRFQRKLLPLETKIGGCAEWLRETRHKTPGEPDWIKHHLLLNLSDLGGPRRSGLAEIKPLLSQSEGCKTVLQVSLEKWNQRLRQRRACRHTKGRRVPEAHELELLLDRRKGLLLKRLDGGLRERTDPSWRGEEPRDLGSDFGGGEVSCRVRHQTIYPGA
jgi:hypothetical protein